MKDPNGRETVKCDISSYSECYSAYCCWDLSYGNEIRPSRSCKDYEPTAIDKAKANPSMIIGVIFGIVIGIAVLIALLTCICKYCD